MAWVWGICPSNGSYMWGIWTAFRTRGRGIWLLKIKKFKCPGGGCLEGGCWCYKLIGALSIPCKSNCILCCSVLLCCIVHSVKHNFALCHEGPGSRIPASGFWISTLRIPDSNLLDSGFLTNPNHCGFRIPTANICWIPDSLTWGE